MPILRLNAGDGTVALHRSAADPWSSLRALAGGSGPVIVMVHGFKYRPGTPGRCPHERIFAPSPGPERRGCSWPAALGCGPNAGPGGLALAFGWQAQGTIWRAYDRAAEAGALLARVIGQIRRAAPTRPIHAIAHSLGARVVLQALPFLAPGDLGRIIALNPAEYHGAAAALLGCAAGRRVEMLTVRGRENLAFDLAFQASVRPRMRRDRALGLRPLTGPGQHLLRLDCPETAARLARLGFALAPARPLACHWQPYLRGGLWPLYRSLLHQPDRLPLAALSPTPESAARGGLRRHPSGGALAEST